MSEKPTCRKCGVEHWRFVKCADAEVAASREQANDERRRAAQVIPEWRSDLDKQITPVYKRPVWIGEHDGPKAA